MRKPIFAVVALLAGVSLLLAFVHPIFWAAFGLMLACALIGLVDVSQRKQTIRRNFPVIGHFRYLLELIRPEINQYFIESNTDGRPFNREERSLVYQRAKGQLDTVPFGTQWDVYADGYEWMAHSIRARSASHEAPRVRIGEHTCEQPYDASLLNISAMSFGSLSANAVLALNKGAAMGGFAHNTGEGGVSTYHLRHGGDLIWQIGTGYFGCRDDDGNFDLDRFRENAARPTVKMIEVKLSQGAKPGHGGILPARKLTEEIAGIRGVPLGKDVISPPGHSAFDDPEGMLAFLRELRDASGGKPVGIKLCVGQPTEIMAMCKAMCRMREQPDFIAVDGGEGGTGAAPLEFSNSVGWPLVEGLVFVHNCLVGFGLRDRVRVIATGKVASGFEMARKLALGADLCAAARPMMMAIGCIQARRCNANDCPVGVATQEPALTSGLDVEDKGERTARFQRETVEGLLELTGAAGLDSPAQIGPQHVLRRVEGTTVRSYLELYPYLERGALLFEPVPEAYEEAWRAASPDTFEPLRERGGAGGLAAV